MALDAIIHRRKASWWQEFQQAPYSTLAKALYSQRQRLAAKQEAEEGIGAAAANISVVCVSDTHNSQPKLPPGDILVHAGDMTQGGSIKELQNQLSWLESQPHAHKLVIAGNHDIALDDTKSAELGVSPMARQSLKWASVAYLEHSTTKLEIQGRTLTIFGHPSTRKHGNWAFQYEKGFDAFTNQVADDVDILITHSAPRFHLDVAGWGDEFLLQELWRTKPKLHVFGHIHEGYGRDILIYDVFEQLYARVCYGSAGALALFHMALLLLGMLVKGIDREEKRTVLINAAAVGGLYDQNAHSAQVVRL